MEEPEEKHSKLARNWIIGIVVAVIVTGAGFYWVAVRPNNIRHSCHEKAIAAYEAGGLQQGFPQAEITYNVNTDYYANTTPYLNAYNSCLQNAGLSTQ